MNIDNDRIINEVRSLLDDLARYSETAEVDSFLRCYADIPDFLAVSADGVIRNYGDFKKICKDYYNSVKEQKLATTHEYFMFWMKTPLYYAGQEISTRFLKTAMS